MILDEQFCHIDSKTRSLVIDLREFYGQDSGLIRIRPWAEQLLMEHLEPSGWCQDDEAFDYPLVSVEIDDLLPSHPLREFSDSLPMWARDCARPFRLNQLRLLRILSIDKRSLGFAKSNPLIFWLLPECLTSQSSNSEISHILGLCRREIISLSLGHGSKSLIKLLNKIYDFGYEIDDFDALRNLIRSYEWSSLNHVVRINWQALKPFCHKTEWLKCRAVQNLMNESGFVDSWKFPVSLRLIVGDIYRMARVMGLTNLTARINSTSNYVGLQRLHDSLAARLNLAKIKGVEERLGQQFPTSPIPWHKDIHQITSVDELLSEGYQMHHCVGSYIERVFDGKCFIFKVLRPQRATLELVETHDGKFRIGQIKLACNQSASIETFAYIRQWIEGWNQHVKSTCSERRNGHI